MIEWPFERKPRQVQIDALNKGHLRKGYAYFMRMRMGKTGTVLADFELHRRAGRVDFAICVVPNSLKLAWVDALGEWGLDLPRCMYEATRKSDADHFFMFYPQGVFIINYDSLSYFFTNLVEQHNLDLSKCMLICDESTSFKAPDTNRSKILVKHAKHFGYKRILTGKPRANSNLDLWPQLKVIDAIEQGMFSFRATYCYMGGWEGRQIVGDKNNELLQGIIHDHGFIAGDEYLKDLPEKIYMPLVKVEMLPEQAKYYKEMEKDFLASIGDETCTASIALVKYLRLRQLTSGIYTPDGQPPTNLMAANENPRVKATLELMDGTPNKAMVVATFINSLDSLYRMCEAAGYNPALISGGMTPADLHEQKRKFNEDYTCKVIIGQESIMQFGHMLSGPDDCPCDTIIFYENDFSIINRAQSEARPEVLGRKIPIAIYDLYSSGMDKKIIEALRSKENAAIAMMGYARSQGVLPLVEAEELATVADKASENEFLQQCALNDALAFAGF